MREETYNNFFLIITIAIISFAGGCVFAFWLIYQNKNEEKEQIEKLMREKEEEEINHSLLNEKDLEEINDSFFWKIPDNVKEEEEINDSLKTLKKEILMQKKKDSILILNNELQRIRKKK